MMTVPIARFVPAPVPLETTSGIMPATKASVVIRIGRSRSRLAWRIASARGIPCARRSFMWSICRIPFFFTMPKSTRMPSDEKMLIDWSKHHDREQRERHRQRQREQDRDRVDPALELRRQDQVHEDDRGQERDQEVARRLALLARAAGEAVAVGRRHLQVLRRLRSGASMTACDE